MAIESRPKKKSSGSSSMLAPGFRFHPTDEELVRYYLRRKVCGKAFRIDAISEIDIYKTEPWDLPSFSKLKSRDLEWYFFSVLDKKYGNGSRTNRATEKGYWKTTGKDRAVYHRTQIVGMKKTLVYHIGRAPKGQRSNWVMHEYRLTDLELERAGIGQDAFVLCRVFQKSGSGPKNGEQYGAPFVEEEWEEDELELVPKAESAEEVDFGDAYLDGDDLEQILGSDDPSDPAQSDPAPLPLSSCGEETAESFNDNQKHLVSAGNQYSEAEPLDDENLYDWALPALYELDARPVKHEYIGESSKSDDLDFLLDEPFVDSSDNLKCSEGGFIEANDFANTNETNTSAFKVLDDYLTFFDTSDDTLLELPYDPSVILGNEDLVSDHVLLPEKELDDGPMQSMLANEQHDDNNNNDDASPSDKQDSAKYESDYEYPFTKHASQMLGALPGPTAFATEFPSKEAVCHNSLSQPSSSVHVIAGMIQIRNLNDNDNDRNQFLKKHENLNIVLSFGFLQSEDGSTRMESSVGIQRGKNVSTLTRGWFYFICLWVLILSITFKIGTIIRAN